MTLPNTGNYPYTSDIGTPSLSQLQMLAQSSEVGFTVTSGYRNIAGENNGWHLYSNAIDMASTNADMTQLANYLHQFAPFLLELIHTNPDGSGAYVKNGQVVSASYYGQQTVDEHRDHVHLAGTVSAMVAASQWAHAHAGQVHAFPVPADSMSGSTGTGDMSADNSGKANGCLQRMGLVSAAGIGLLAGVSWAVHLFL